MTEPIMRSEMRVHSSSQVVEGNLSSFDSVHNVSHWRDRSWDWTVYREGLSSAAMLDQIEGFGSGGDPSGEVIIAGGRYVYHSLFGSTTPMLDQTRHE